MDKRVVKRAAKTIGLVQPHCQEEILAALTWSRTRTSMSEIAEVLGPQVLKPNACVRESRVSPGVLPDPVLLAVGSESIYAFDFAPRLFGFEVKRLVVCWPRHDLTVAVERANTVTYLTITTRLGESHALEVSTLTMPRGQLVEAFLDVLGPESVERLYLGY